MTITLPELSLVVLIGASGSGKSTFARTHFKPTEVLSSDFCRALVADDENDQSATTPAFDVLHHIASKRLEGGRLTVVDATNVRPEDRKHLVKLAREHHVLPVAIVFNVPEKVCHERNAARDDRNFGPHVIRQQRQAMRRSMRMLKREGFRHVFIFDTVEEVEAARVERQPLWNNRKHEHGPFDIIGDVHGCYEELAELLRELDFVESEPFDWRPPEGRRAIFLGDLVDRGPDSPRVLRTAMRMSETGAALCVPGNHDMKLVRKLSGRNVQITHGLAETLEQLEREPPEFHEQVRRFLDGLVSHYVFDDGKLVVAHAGMKEKLQGRGSGAVREFALYGETTGETDEFGLPIRYNWAAEYRGHAHVVYGHTPVPEPEWLNRTINIDTGCVFGGRLTALRYPEMQLVSVPAKRMYAEPRRPFLPEESAAIARDGLTAQQAHDDVLDLEDVFGKRIISARLSRSITIREGNAAAALEVMSRFAVDPRWLIYLPPTMSPVETSQLLDFLEHPAEAFAYYRSQGVPEVVCEEKHMGSRAIVIVCRDEDAARRRFGVIEESVGMCYTRTGRRFFNDESLEREFLDRIRTAAESAGLWAEFETDWLCLDCELMPWSAKAQALLSEQYAAVGASAAAMLGTACEAIEQAKTRGVELNGLDQRTAERRGAVDHYVRAYRQYCWPVASISDYKLAPFHLLATEGRMHADRDHLWHMETLTRLCEADRELLLATPHRLVNLTDDASVNDATAWWLDMVTRGGEGMVVKPRDFIARGRRGIIQPAVKCRGPEYLRIIYGPEYDRPENLDRLRRRGLAHKRSLAIREFALGIESLERFVHREPLRHVHECVFGVLALESEPVDPRL